MVYGCPYLAYSLSQQLFSTTEVNSQTKSKAFYNRVVCKNSQRFMAPLLSGAAKRRGVRAVLQQLTFEPTLHGSSATSKTRFIDGSSYLEADCITCFKSFLNQSGSSSSPLLSSSMLDFVIPGFFYEQGIIEFIILQLPLRGVKLSSARQFQIGCLISVGAP